MAFWKYLRTMNPGSFVPRADRPMKRLLDVLAYWTRCQRRQTFLDAWNGVESSHARQLARSTSRLTVDES